MRNVRSPLARLACRIFRRSCATCAAAATAATLAACGGEETLAPVSGDGEPAPFTAPTLVGFAMLPAATFAAGPTSGAHLGAGSVNAQPLPFVDKQPVQGFSAVLARGDGSFLAMSDNGFGTLESSADYHLRVYTIRPSLRAEDGGPGEIAVEGFIELSDPYRHVPFAITNHFTPDRVLTGADFDIESMQRAPDGTLWFGDEFGPFLLHADVTGRLLDPPIPLPDFDAGEGVEIRSPQNPSNEEASGARVMNAVRTHARLAGGARTPVLSPSHALLRDDDLATAVDSRAEPPAGSGLAPASSEIFDIDALHKAGYPVVPYTVNDLERMKALLELGVDGLISDRPDLLRQAVEAFDADGDGTPGDLIGADGLIDGERFDAQGHRGGRDLRPENTLPAFEVALDSLVTTLELDAGITADGVPVINHDPHIQAQKCRRVDGAPYGAADELLIKDLGQEELQSTFLCDKLFRGPQQQNDAALSPVTGAFVTATNLPSAYAMPSLEQLFHFVDFYVNHYRTGPGKDTPDAVRRWRNAARIRFNIETKVNPRAQFAARTFDADTFADTVAGTIAAWGLERRADVQSFDFRTLLRVQEQYPEIRTVYLFGDFPLFTDPSVAGSDDGTNLQDEAGENTPWLAGLAWPYRITQESAPFGVQRSGGFEGMALSADGKKLLPLIEKPLAGAAGKALVLHEFDLAEKRYTGVRYEYTLDERGVSVPDFIMIDETHGLTIERDDSEGDLGGFKAIFQVELPPGGGAVAKQPLVDLLKIADPLKLAPAGAEGDVGLGEDFALPFQTIESVILLDARRIGVLNDNNYPFSVGRHVGTGMPDDDEMIVIDVGRDLVDE